MVDISYYTLNGDELDSVDSEQVGRRSADTRPVLGSTKIGNGNWEVRNGK